MSLMVAIENNALATWLRSSAWGYPAVETLHILGLALLFCTAVAFDLRLLSVPSSLPVDGVARFLLPLARIGFALAVVWACPIHNASPDVRRDAALLRQDGHRLNRRDEYDDLPPRYLHIGTSMERCIRTPRRARIAAVVSLVCWTLALVCGRFLAYV